MYPLSEVLSVVQIIYVSSPGRSDEIIKEEAEWQNRCVWEFENVIRQRGWSEQDIKAALSSGHAIYDRARRIMFPDDAILAYSEPATT